MCTRPLIRCALTAKALKLALLAVMLEAISGHLESVHFPLCGKGGISTGRSKDSASTESHRSDKGLIGDGLSASPCQQQASFHAPLLTCLVHTQGKSLADEQPTCVAASPEQVRKQDGIAPRSAIP